MTAPRYGIAAPSVALSAATAKTVIGVKAHANSGLLWLGYSLGFDGVTASAVPGVIELCYCTWATNGPGTNSTSATPAQVYGRALTAGFTAGYNWTTEPTVLTAFRKFDLSPNSSTLLWDFPLGTEPDCNLAEGFAIRCTFPASVGIVASIDVARC